MAKILVLVHPEADGSLSRAALEAVEAGRRLGGELAIGFVGNAPAALDFGPARLLGVLGEAFTVPRYSTDAAAGEALARAAGAELILAPGTSRSNRALPGVAARLGGRADTHVVGVTAEGGVKVTRWFYRQRMEAVLERAERPWVILLEPGSGAPAELPASAAPPAIEAVEVAVGDVRTRVTGRRAPQTGEQTIRPEAELLFVAGAGWTKKQKDGQTHVEEAAGLILDFITKTQASLGSSKSLVDLSGEGQAVLPFLSHLNQVGQTGSTPRHPKGLAACCHGEEPHVVGWRFIGDRRAVNLDANCGWARGKADVLYVADAFEVMARLNELLKQGG